MIPSPTSTDAPSRPLAAESKSRSTAESAASQSAATAGRMLSLDAFRGLVMLLMASGGAGLPQIARKLPESSMWQLAAHQADHAAWRGCTLWDLIQPAFMFMVGVALPWSLANRQARGARFGGMFAHAVWRSVVLVACGVFLASAWSNQTNWMFTNVLAQIGLGYPFLFLLAFTRVRTQWLAAGAILAGTWLAFALTPAPPADFDWRAVGVSTDWTHFTGFFAHWEKNANLGWRIDTWLLNLFPRATPFTHNAGGYVTLNFVPSLATMIFGLIAGNLLRCELAPARKAARLALAGVAALAVGLVLDVAGICPMVKRLWTPSFAIFSAGWVALALAAFVVAVDARGWRRWTFPLVVAGLNPIALYFMWQLMSRPVRETLQTHLGRDVFASFGTLYTPMLERLSVLFVLWLILLWMYRRKIFLRI